MNAITYRSFRNDDPPRILRLWRQCELGRGAAQPTSTDAFETINYAQTYFDPQGLILAECDREPVGFVHAGFGFNAERSAIDPQVGVICVVMVQPDFRRRGIGRELIQRAEAYLRERGAVSIAAGESRSSDPFYFGLYGGSRPSGFLDSDPLAAPFLTSIGYVPEQTIGVYQRDLTVKRDPTNMKLVGLRRTTELVIAESPLQPSYWWYCHMGRSETLRFRLVDRKTQAALAAVTVMGLDYYIPTWNERAIGLVDVFVSEGVRGQGYGQTLLVETLRRVREELITRAEIHVPDTLDHLVKSVLGAGFTRLETGTVYRRAT